MAKLGIDAERELVNKLWESGFAVLRAPGSGGATKMPRPDILAGNSNLGLILAIELKTTRSTNVYLTSEEIDNLVLFSERFGATPLVAVKFIGKRTSFIFLKIYDLKITPKGNYSVSLKLALEKGITFEELIHKQTQARLEF